MQLFVVNIVQGFALGTRHLIIEIMKIVMMLNLVVVLASLGLVAYAHLGIKKPPFNPESELDRLKSEAVESTKLVPIRFDKIILNLESRKTRLRFLDVEINLLGYTLDDQKILEKNKKLYQTFINDVLIDIAAKMKPHELNSVTGKLLFSSKIKKGFQKRIGKDLVKKVLFTRFVIQ